MKRYLHELPAHTSARWAKERMNRLAHALGDRPSYGRQPLVYKNFKKRGKRGKPTYEDLSAIYFRRQNHGCMWAAKY